MNINIFINKEGTSKFGEYAVESDTELNRQEAMYVISYENNPINSISQNQNEIN